MTTHPAAPPEARLIAGARKAKGLTPEQAAELLPASIAIKGGRWRQIEAGSYSKQGRRVPTQADDMLLAHMAHAVGGVSPEQLDEINKVEAADILRNIQRQERSVHAPLVDRMRDDPEFMRVWERLEPEDRKALLARLDELDNRVKDDIVTYARALARPRGETAT